MQHRETKLALEYIFVHVKCTGRPKHFQNTLKMFIDTVMFTGDL